MRIFLILLLVSFSCFGFPETAQDSVENKQKQLNYATGPAPDPFEFDEENIETLKEQPAFDYAEKETVENWWAKFKRYVELKWHNFLDWLFGDYQTNSIVAFLLQFIPYLILFGVLAFAIWLFAKLNLANSLLNDAEKAKVFLSEEEEIIQSRHIQKLIETALAAKDFRLAIRYRFLLILQQLTEKEIIEYEFSKTDEDYLAEIKQENHQKQFRQLTRIYDFVWYGHFEATQEDYKKAEKEFLKMQDLIGQKNE